MKKLCVKLVIYKDPVYASLFRDNKLGNMCTYFVPSIVLLNYVVRNNVTILNACLYTRHKDMQVK